MAEPTLSDVLDAIQSLRDYFDAKLAALSGNPSALDNSDDTSTADAVADTDDPAEDVTDSNDDTPVDEMLPSPAPGGPADLLGGPPFL